MQHARACPRVNAQVTPIRIATRLRQSSILQRAFARSRMHRFLRRLSLIGIAGLLVHCAAPQVDEGASSYGGLKKSTVAKDTLGDRRDALVSVRSADRAPRTADLKADVHAYLAKHVAGATFAEIDVAEGVDHVIHVRLAETQQGVKVWGADVVVHATDLEVLGFSGAVAPASARLARLATTPAISGSDALAIAKADRLGARAVTTDRESVEPIVRVDEDGAHLAWHTTFFHEVDGDLVPGLWRHLVDARTGDLLARWNDIHRLSQASGASGNAKYQHVWMQELDVEESAGAYVMTTPRLRTMNMNGAQSGAGSEVTGPLDGWNDAAINDAHGYAEITLNMLSSWFGHDSIDDRGFRIVSRVHYGRNYENAFWDGTQMTYGDGATTFYPLSGAVDVVAHEIHHGFTTKHSNLAYSGEPGGLNEGFSDIAGKTAEFFYKPVANWDLGADIFKAEGAALRYMCTPARDGSSIENAAQMTPGMDPHYSSGVPNKFFCRLAKRMSGSLEGNATAAGVRRAATAVFHANAHYWTSSTTFVQGCQGTVDAARSLAFDATEIEMIKQSWVDVGVYCDGLVPPPPPCDETIDAAAGTITSPDYPNSYPNSLNRTWCIDAGEGRRLSFAFDDFETEGGYDFVRLADGTGRQLSKTSGNVAPAAVTVDRRLYVTFTTDYTVGRKGWKASWTSQ